MLASKLIRCQNSTTYRFTDFSCARKFWMYFFFLFLCHPSHMANIFSSRLLPNDVSSIYYSWRYDSIVTKLEDKIYQKNYRGVSRVIFFSLKTIENKSTDMFILQAFIATKYSITHNIIVSTFTCLLFKIILTSYINVINE